VITFGTVTTPDAGTTLVYSPIASLSPYAFLLYSGASGQTAVTRTGAGTIPIPAGVTTAKGEVWADGQPGGSNSAPGFNPATGGGGSGEYAQEPNLAVTGGGTVAYATAGATATLTGSVATVTAHRGTAGGTGPGSGGTGSANTIHTNGGNGAGPSGSTGGKGGNAPNGGTGGTGGAPGANGHPGVAPGAGGGGTGSHQVGGGAGGAGAAGQVRLTYSTGAPPILLSVAAAAGTDQFGTPYPAGMQVAGGDGNTYDTERLSLFLAADTPIPSTSATTLISKPVAAGTYEIEGIVKGVQGANAAGQFVRFSGPAVSFNDIFIESNAVGNTSVTDSDLTGVLPVDHTTPAWGAGVVFYVRFRGILIFTAAGTFALQGRANSAVNTWTAKAASMLNLYPVVAA
jgi:hypothetical protein